MDAPEAHQRPPGSGPYAVRPAAEADAAPLAALHVRAWQWAYRGLLADAYLDGLAQQLAQREGMWRRQLRGGRPGHPVWVAERAGGIIGFCNTAPARDGPADAAELHTLYLEPDVVGTGVGAALMRHALAELRARGVRTVALWVLDANARARRRDCEDGGGLGHVDPGGALPARPGRHGGPRAAHRGRDAEPGRAADRRTVTGLTRGPGCAGMRERAGCGWRPPPRVVYAAATLSVATPRGGTAERSEPEHPVALVTGGSRGIGAATALALAERGYAVAITYRNKSRRAAEVVGDLERRGAAALAVAGDLTDPGDRARLLEAVAVWCPGLDVLVLNASGGLEPDLVAADPDYPTRINRDAQVALVDGALALLRPRGTVVFVTSHWAHLHGRVAQLPAYEPVAASKHAGEVALRARQGELARRDVRLLVVTGDLVEGTITPRLLERRAPGLTGDRRQDAGPLPTAGEMGAAIAAAATDPSLPSGHTVIIGGTLESLPTRPASDDTR